MANNNGSPVPYAIPPGWVFYPYPQYMPVPVPAPNIAAPPNPPTTAVTGQEIILREKSPPPRPSPPRPPPTPFEIPCSRRVATLTHSDDLLPGLPSQIKFVACHHCVVCGHPRSHAYHREHPLIPGQVAPASACRKCAKKHQRGEPIDSIIIPIRGRPPPSDMESKKDSHSGAASDSSSRTRVTVQYEHHSHRGRSSVSCPKPSPHPVRSQQGLIRSVSYRHVAPRSISRPRIASLDGDTVAEGLPSPPLVLPPPTSAPKSKRVAEKSSYGTTSNYGLPSPQQALPPPSAPKSKSVVEKSFYGTSFTCGPPPPPSIPNSKPIDNRGYCHTVSNDDGPSHNGRSRYVSQPLPTCDTRDINTLRDRGLSATCETRGIIRPSRKPGYRTPSPNSEREEVRHTHDAVKAHFGPDPVSSRQVRYDEPGHSPYYRHVKRRKEEAVPKVTERGAPPPKSSISYQTERRGRNLLLIRRSPSPSPTRSPSPADSPTKWGGKLSRVRPDYEAYRAYHNRAPTPPPTHPAPTNRPCPPPPLAPSPPFGQDKPQLDPPGPWLNPQPHNNVTFSERSNYGSNISVQDTKKSVRAWEEVVGVDSKGQPVRELVIAETTHLPRCRAKTKRGVIDV